MDGVKKARAGVLLLPWEHSAGALCVHGHAMPLLVGATGRRWLPVAGCRGQVPGGGCRKLDAVGLWLFELLAVIPSLSPLLPWWN